MCCISGVNKSPKSSLGCEKLFALKTLTSKTSYYASIIIWREGQIRLQISFGDDFECDREFCKTPVDARLDGLESRHQKGSGLLFIPKFVVN